MNTKPERVALYARVSTSDKQQNPETQLIDLRQLAEQRGYTVVEEYVDYASANDQRGRVEWARLMDDAIHRRFDAVVVWRLDRAFRSVLHGSLVLSTLRDYRVDFISCQEPYIDTTTTFGEFMFHMTVAWAELERGIISERVQAGVRRARREGKRLGRPTVAVDLDYVKYMKANGRGWDSIAREHPLVVVSGKKVRPSRSSIRRAWDKMQKQMEEDDEA